MNIYPLRPAVLFVALTLPFGLVRTAIGDEAHPPAADAPPPEPKVKVTIFALPHPDVEETRMVEILRGLETGLKKNGRLEMKDLDTRLADFAQETPTEQVEAARTLANDGRQALLQLRIPEAVQKLQDAVSGLAKVLPHIKKQELADTMAALAVAQFEGGDKQSGIEQFVELATWRPDYSYDTSGLPPKYAAHFEDAQRRVERAKKAPISIASSPSGAQAYIDGKFIGVTPCTSEPLPVGTHFVSLKKEGFKKAVRSVVLQKKGETKADIALERAQKYLLVEQARATVEKTMGADVIDPESETLKTVLFLDQAVFVKAARNGEKIEVDAFLYDLRHRHRLSKVHQVVPAASAEKALEPVATTLYTGVSYDGELAVPVENVPQRKKPKPWYKTWWFWTAVGAGAVLTAGTIGVYYAVDATRPPSCPDGMSCLQFGP